jgi:hypothetical protein
LDYPETAMITKLEMEFVVAGVATRNNAGQLALLKSIQL